MVQYPLFFKHGGLVAGKGFIARVRITGRCLLEQTEDNFFSVFGVNPGGIASDGETIEETHKRFLNRVQLTVFDFAKEAADFPEFRKLVGQFVRDTNVPNERSWTAAAAAVRKGALDLEGYERENCENSIKVAVELVAGSSLPKSKTPTYRPQMNQEFAEDFRVAAACR